jgi:FtsH-binding integral membrane protein
MSCKIDASLTKAPLLLVYIVVSVSLLVYSFSASFKGVQIWKLKTRTDTTLQRQYPIAAFVVAISLYIFASAVIVITKKRNSQACPYIIPLLITAMCAEDGLMPKFDAGNSREFVYWAVTMLLRATLITNELGNNFLLETICALILPAITIFGRAFSLKG